MKTLKELTLLLKISPTSFRAARFAAGPLSVGRVAACPAALFADESVHVGVCEAVSEHHISRQAHVLGRL